MFLVVGVEAEPDDHSIILLSCSKGGVIPGMLHSVMARFMAAVNMSVGVEWGT